MRSPSGENPVRTAIEIAVSLVLIGLVLVWCLRIIEPFASLIIWGAVLAVSLQTPYHKLVDLAGGSRKLGLALFVLIGLVIVIVPAVLFAETIVSSVGGLRASMDAGEFSVPPPREGVRDWPLIGERIYGNWAAAAANLEDWLSANNEQIKHLMGAVLGKLANVGLGVLQFVLSILIAAAMLANADAAAATARRFFERLMGGVQATEMMTLSASTIRSVAVGVLGIAFIQAVLGGAGMIAVGVPAAGLLTLVILILAIAQLPPWLVLLPVIVYVFSIHSTPVAVVFAVWSLVVSFADMALKPMLLGRGVEAPMPVILLGAIGGMIMSGIIGLFVGAVVLALGYKLFLAWLGDGDEPPPEQAKATD